MRGERGRRVREGRIQALVEPNMCDLRLSNPFCMLVAGSSQTGKTQWVHNLLKQSSQVYRKKPGPVHFYFREWQPLFDKMPHASFHKEMPTMESLKNAAWQNATVIIDDMIHHVNKDTAELFTVGSSRYGVNLILITQNLFDKSPYFRTISLNCRYFCIRKNPRDSSSISRFAKQVFPSHPNFMIHVYRDVTNKKAYSYIFFDASQDVSEHMRLRSNVLREEGSPVICFHP